MMCLLLAVCFSAVFPPLTVQTQNAEASPYLLFSTFFTVSRINLDGSGYSVVVDDTTFTQISGIHSVDYHWRLSKVFWTHIQDGNLGHANLDGSNPTIIVSNLSRPEAVAVDWINDKVYFSSSNPDLPQVWPDLLSVYDITTGETDVVTPDTVQYDLYYDLAVDPVNEKLYWTDGTSLVLSTLSGQDVEVLLTPSCGPRYIYLNVNLYWSQEFCSSEGVYSLNLTTMEVSVIVEGDTNELHHDVAVYEDTVFWTGNAKVSSAAVSGGNVTEVVTRDTTGIGTGYLGLVIVHPDLQPENTQSELPTSTTDHLSSSQLTSSVTTTDHLSSSQLTSSVTTTLHSSSATLHTTSQPKPSHSPTESSENSNMNEMNTVVAALAAVLIVTVCLLGMTCGIFIYSKRKSLSRSGHQAEDTMTTSHNDPDIVTNPNIVYSAIESSLVKEQDKTQDGDSEYEVMRPISGAQLEASCEQNTNKESQPLYEKINEDNAYELDDLEAVANSKALGDASTSTTAKETQPLYMKIVESNSYESDDLISNDAYGSLDGIVTTSSALEDAVNANGASAQMTTEEDYEKVNERNTPESDGLIINEAYGSFNNHVTTSSTPSESNGPRTSMLAEEGQSSSNDNEGVDESDAGGFDDLINDEYSDVITMKTTAGDSVNDNGSPNASAFVA